MLSNPVYLGLPFSLGASKLPGSFSASNGTIRAIIGGWSYDRAKLPLSSHPNSRAVGRDQVPAGYIRRFARGRHLVGTTWAIDFLKHFL